MHPEGILKNEPQPCPQVSCCGILVAGAGHRHSHGDGRGDRGDLAALHGAGCARGHRLRYGQLRVQERQYNHLHAAAQDTLNDRECLQHVAVYGCLHVSWKGRCESVVLLVFM